MLISILTRIRASETASGEDEWFLAGHGPHGPLGSGPESRFGLGLGAGEWIVKECVDGVQRLGHGNRELAWMWRGRMLCKGGSA